MLSASLSGLPHSYVRHLRDVWGHPPVNPNGAGWIPSLPACILAGISLNTYLIVLKTFPLSVVSTTVVDRSSASFFLFGTSSCWKINKIVNRKPVMKRIVTRSSSLTCFSFVLLLHWSSPERSCKASLQKGGVPAAPSGTATLLRLSPSYQFYPRSLLDGYELQVPPASMA